MRSPELWLRRSFRRVVVSLLASPLAMTSACRDAANRPNEATDATLSSACESFPVDGASIEGNPDGCSTFHLLPCGLPPSAHLEGCFVDIATCVAPCTDTPDAAFFLYCQLAPVSCDDAGDVLDAATIVECVSCQGITGRRPLGLRRRSRSAGTPLAEYFESMAHLEEASVRAFRDLEQWLTRLGAPLRLSRAARRSAGDERRHARAAARLARRFGGTVMRPRVRRVAAPTLFELLEDDAIEGCVNETLGALLATWQAETAGDADVRCMLRSIAVDETRHAALAWEILAWGTERLSQSERRRVGRALEGAVAALETRAPARVHASVRQVTGHPPIEAERRLVRELARLVREGARRCFVT